MCFQIIFVTSLLLTKFLEVEEDYQGHRIYGVTPKTEEQVENLYNISELYPELDFLKQTALVNETAHIIVAPENIRWFTEHLTNYTFNFEVLDYDLSHTIKEQKGPDFEILDNDDLSNRTKEQQSQDFIRLDDLSDTVKETGRRDRRCIFRKKPSARINLAKYNRYLEIDQYLEFIAKEFPDRVILQNIGTSYEGRTIKAITIINNPDKISKNNILIDAGIHAREWLSTATALYIINELLDNYKKYEHLLDNLSWVIVPLVNPDGYEYTHRKDRLWRKTRRLNTDPKCPGTDANRNFDFHWGEDKKGTNQCDDIYRGRKPFSESESQAVRDLMNVLGSNCKFYLTLHSFGRRFLLPWGYMWNLPKDYTLMEKVAKAGYDAIISATDKTYLIMSITRITQNIAGTSMDYAHGVKQIPVTITMELPHGGKGFDPTIKELPALTSEAWIGIKAMAEELKKLYS